MFLSTDDQSSALQHSCFCLLKIKALCSTAVVFLSTDDLSSALQQSFFCLLMIKVLLYSSHVSVY